MINKKRAISVLKLLSFSLYPFMQVKQFVVEDIQVWQGDSQAKHCEVVESAGNVYPSLQLLQLWAVSHPLHSVGHATHIEA